MKRMWLWDFLLSILFETRQSESRIENATEEEVFSLLRPTLLEHTDGVALFPYRHPLIRALITEVKFHGNEKARRLLARAVSLYLEEEIAEHQLTSASPLYIVPIPLSRRRIRERGYNQVEFVLREALTYHTSAPFALGKFLVRKKDTVPQTTLSKGERLKNMEDAFVCKDVPECAVILLVDDVSTTGATLSSARKALQESGAKEIRALAFAH